MVQTQLLTLSDIHTIAPIQVNPNAEIAERIIEQLCRDTGIWLPQLEDYTTMSSYLYPKTSTERLIAMGLANNFLFFIDDVYDRHKKQNPNVEQEVYMRKVFDNCINIMLDGTEPEDDHVVYDASFELYRRFSPLTTRAWLKRLLFSLLKHLKSSTYTLDDIIEQEQDTVEQYIKLRVLDSGMDPTIDFIEFAWDIHLPDKVLNHPFLQEARARVSRIGALANDLFSYSKEVQAHGSRFNLVPMLMDARGLSFDEAVHQSVSLINECINNFMKSEQQIPVWSDEKINHMVRLYMEGLRDEIVATWHWQMSTNRYRSPDSPFPELRTLL